MFVKKYMFIITILIAVLLIALITKIKEDKL